MAYQPDAVTASNSQATLIAEIVELRRKLADKDRWTACAKDRLRQGLTYGDDMVSSLRLCVSDALALLEG